MDAPQFDGPAPISAASPKSPSSDYFSMRKRKDSKPHNQLSPSWPRLSSTSSSLSATPIAPNLSHSASSKGSWSSLFNARGSVRQLLEAASMGPPATDGPHVPSPKIPGGIPVPARGRTQREGGPTQKPAGEGDRTVTPSVDPMYNSWSESRPSPTRRTPVSFSSAGHGRRRTISQMATLQSNIISEKRMHVVKLADQSR